MNKALNLINHRHNQFSLHYIIYYDDVLTGSTLSQLLYFGGKSQLITCPHTDVILNRTFSPWSLPFHSCMEHAPFDPFLLDTFPFERIFANERAKLGFSATISAITILRKSFSEVKNSIQSVTVNVSADSNQCG